MEISFFSTIMWKRDLVCLTYCHHYEEKSWEEEEEGSNTFFPLCRLICIVTVVKSSWYKCEDRKRIVMQVKGVDLQS